MNKCTDVVTWLNNLPVASVLDEIVKAAECGPVIVGAPPGSGKTLLVPAAIHDALKTGESLVLVQPRRFAARAIAGQIARIRQCRLGDEVGYRVRFDSKVSQATTLCVQTTGVLPGNVLPIRHCQVLAVLFWMNFMSDPSRWIFLLGC